MELLLQTSKKKLGSDTFTTDVIIAFYLLHAAEVVAVPASGFDYDPTAGCLRVSFAVSVDVLTNAVSRMKNAALQVK